MKYKILAAFILLSGATACNHKINAQNPQVKQDTQQAQVIVQSCIAKGSFVTANGRQAILNCIAPKGHKQQFEDCAQSHLGTDGFLTTQQRQHYMQDLSVCVERNR